jgi:CPA1 family monovalent cation:H+ antiporter
LLTSQEKTQVGLLVVVIVLTLILTRVVFVMTMLGTNKDRGDDDWRVVIVAAWSGARGPVSGMAAFSIPLTLDSGAPLPFRNLILATTFGVIVITLLLSSTMGPLARILKVQPVDDSVLIRRVDIALAHAASAQLEEAVEQSALKGQPLPRKVVEPLKRGVNLRLEALEESDGDVGDSRSHQGMDLARLMLRAEQEELLRIRTEEGLPDGIVRPMLEQLEIRRLALETHGDASGHS